MKSKSKMIKVIVWSLLTIALVLLPSLQRVRAQTATFVVNSTADTVDANPGDGVCADSSGKCTLRAAIMEANALPGADTIILPAGTYTLTIPGVNEDFDATGDLDITSDLTITGAGANITTIDGGGIDRVLDICPVNTPNVHISGLTVRGGTTLSSSPDDRSGGGVRNDGTLTLTNVTVRGNTADLGGGIFNDVAGALTINSSTISDNAATFNLGGGGGIFSISKGAALTLNSSTISGNTTPYGGGGIWIYHGTLILNNSTVSGNVAKYGGGIITSNNSIIVKLTNSTISGNSSSNSAAFRTGENANTILKNTIVAGNPGGDCEISVTNNVVNSLGHNLDSDGTCKLVHPTDLPNRQNPLLGPLANNGGPTLTHALLPGSPAIDAGGLDCLPTDQRGVPRPQGAACDIGAYEVGACTQTVSFSPAASYAVGTNPGSVAIGELDGDGKPDLAVANANYNNTVSILLGTGTGSFGGAMDFGVGTFPYSVAIGDLNGDGRQDLVLANYYGHTVSILLGTGGGAFGSATDVAVGMNPGSVAIGDLNSDGKPDLAVANQGSNNVSILLGTGGGAFAGATNFPVGSAPISVAIGDLNSDGKPDLAVANQGSNNVSILLGTGGGAFAGATNFAVGSAPLSVAIGDLDLDGKLDLAVANYGSKNISILAGTGGGAFGGANLAVGTNPTSVAFGDLNGDGKPDLAVANAGSNTVSILVGTGMGTFGSATNFAAGPFPWSVAIGDLNGDGKPDLAVANAVSNTVSILLNTSFCPNQSLVANAGPDQTVEATSPSGASVTLNGSASSDPDGDPLTYNWTGPFGTVSGVSPTVALQLGTHTVALTVNDGHSTATDTVQITVRDTTPPDTIINSAVDGNGAAVASGGSTLSNSITFTFGGTDAVGVSGFQCRVDAAAYGPCSSPASKSALAIGSHIFQVRALDAAGNVDPSPASFSWTVVTPAQAIQNLITTIGNMGLPGGVATSLTAPLSNINTNNQAAACNKLNAFINQVNAKTQNGQLTSAQASQLLQAANAIKTSLGC